MRKLLQVLVLLAVASSFAHAEQQFMYFKKKAAAGGGGKAVRSQSHTASTLYTRLFSSGGISVGTVSWKMRVSISNPNDFVGCVVADGSTGRMYVRFGPTGNIEAYNNVSYVSIGAYSTNTWYTITVDFDDTGQPDKWRVKVDSGAYTGWMDVNGATLAGVTTIHIDDSATNNPHIFYVDDISIPAVSATDDFESYTLTSDLNTLNGNAANWDGAWTKVSGGAMTIETAP